ncbi:LysR family transcriptional regulator [Alicyclobacillus mengziensis]|uniref:LysR family transcriptional regulator n=1 Tax=Alicyclobacillus mengziensis TaxID=2931921 RepID=A0A9X7VWH0_9BACL|nr:LysR family transcriptional regulator [Alicyclobacillus mengziensis]QSO46346.1 LysR family transcriptional regulator [Alicyclobacillus mengziensis]
MHVESHRVFRAAVEYGSITRAAQTLHMTQSTASRHLQTLEDEYGGLLFERSATGITLTPFGRALYPYTCDLLSCHEKAKEELARLRREGGGLSVGATLSIGEYLLPQVLGEVRRTYPQAEIRMRISNTSDVLEDLIRHRIDIALVEGVVEPAMDLRVDTWRDDELVLVCAPDHPFAVAGSIDLEQLVGHPVLFREEGSGTRQVTEAALEGAGIRSSLTIAMELGSTEAIKSAAEAGLGVAFLSRLTVARDCKSGRLVEVPIHGFRISRHLYIVERPERFEKVLVKSLLGILRRG